MKVSMAACRDCLGLPDDGFCRPLDRRHCRDRVEAGIVGELAVAMVLFLVPSAAMGALFGLLAQAGARPARVAGVGCRHQQRRRLIGTATDGAIF